jgi:hexosaminidase
MSRRSVLFLFATIFVILTNCIAEGTINTQTLSIDTAGEALTADSPLNYLIPKPVLVESATGLFPLSADTVIVIPTENAEVRTVAQLLADYLKPATGHALPIQTGAGKSNTITLSTQIADSELGTEGYLLTITPDGVTLQANTAAGLFYGVQTLRQLLPAAIESDTVQSVAWTLPTATIKDYPRFAWRGAMLDVARHFFKPEDVKHYIDLLAYYKINRLHLHLTDDQGWRLMINSWEKLATFGGSTAVGGGAGGYYTQQEYADIVAYAQVRQIIIVPEIDMPGHTNAALASYPELNCDGKAPPLYTETKVGFSSLCVDKEITYKFVEDVIRELAALTPGPYIHIGGDESDATTPLDYRQFMERVETIVEKAGKRPIGWEEMAQVELSPTTIIQHWKEDKYAQAAVKQGAKLILSPASKAYLDMKYDQDTKLGLSWAGLISVQTGYDWNPATEIAGVTEGDILGVEAPLWSETLVTMDDIEFMAFPRLPGYAEIGWSPETGRGWEEYRVRLATHGSRFAALGVNFFRAQQIDWK